MPWAPLIRCALRASAFILADDVIETELAPETLLPPARNCSGCVEAAGYRRMRSPRSLSALSGASPRPVSTGGWESSWTNGP
jgi:hypothetical protein